MRISLIYTLTLAIIAMSGNIAFSQDSLSITGTVFVYNSPMVPAKIEVASDSGLYNTTTDAIGKFELILPKNYRGNIKITGIGIGEMVVKNIELTSNIIIERIPVFEYAVYFGEWGYYHKKVFFGLFKKEIPYTTETQIKDEIPDGVVEIKCLNGNFSAIKHGEVSEVEYASLCKQIVIDMPRNNSY